MASVSSLVPSLLELYSELQEWADNAGIHAADKFRAVSIHQSITRQRLTKKYFQYLSFFAAIIQRAFRMHLARKAYRKALIEYVHKKTAKHYYRSAVRIQAMWRGYWSRKTKFCYSLYREWLTNVTTKSDHLAAEVAEYRLRTKADNIAILEEEARKWLAFVVFKLHHLLRTQSCAGVFSQHSSTELSEFEQLLKAIRYTEYMKRLQQKYQEFVKKYKSKFNNKVLFPIIGDGCDYWYLSLPEMYELTVPVKKQDNTSHVMLHHGPQHTQPFLWRKYRPPVDENRGPFTVRKVFITPPGPRPSPVNGAGDYDVKVNIRSQRDPRFHLYIKHYKLNPDIMEYVDYHVNILLARRPDIVKMKCEKNAMSDIVIARALQISNS